MREVKGERLEGRREEGKERKKRLSTPLHDPQQMEMLCSRGVKVLLQLVNESRHS